jgi:hypothetical protein
MGMGFGHDPAAEADRAYEAAVGLHRAASGLDRAAVLHPPVLRPAQAAAPA